MCQLYTPFRMAGCSCVFHGVKTRLQTSSLRRRLDGGPKICKSDSMKLPISATEAARSFSELMNRVRYRGEVQRGGKPIAEVVPATPAEFSGRELADLLRSLPQPDEEYFAAVEDLIAKQSTVAEL
jgi:antitoxin (DNA-binding transcriptional repressor) of toxin-antitoxin stability system